MIFIFIVIQVIVAVICTEALTELAVKSDVFHPLRKFLFKSRFKILNVTHTVFDCGYCFSVWAAALSMYLVFYTSNVFTISFILLLLIHRLSNLFHFIMDFIGDRG